MTTRDLVDIHPTELKFPFELKKQISCSFQLTNKTSKVVAIKVKTTNHRKYCVRPNTCVVLPGSTCSVSVIMQAQREAPQDMQCKDKFLVQSVTVSDGTTSEEVVAEMFNEKAGRVIQNVKLRVLYIPAESSSSVPDGSEEHNHPRTSVNKVPRTLGKTNDKSSEASLPQRHQVFVNFRGEQLRNTFVSHLVEALRRNEINVFIDKQELRGEDISILLERIKDSRIALVVFSSRYTESKWCLREAAQIKDSAEQGMLKVLPIFYKVSTSNVKQLKGVFGDHFRDREWEYRNNQSIIESWKEALAFISGKLGLTFDERSLESDFIELIVKEVLRLLASIPSTHNS